MSLQAKLDAFKANFEAGRPPYSVPRSVIETMHRATAELIESGAAGRAKKAGDVAPSFSLKDPEGNVINSADLLKRGPVVLSFYRGVWCPYCNMELQALEAAKPEFDAYGTSLVAILLPLRFIPSTAISPPGATGDFKSAALTMWPSDVSTISRVWAIAGSALMMRARVRPSMPGMSMSRIATS